MISSLLSSFLSFFHYSYSSFCVIFSLSSADRLTDQLCDTEIANTSQPAVVKEILKARNSCEAAHQKTAQRSQFRCEFVLFWSPVCLIAAERGDAAESSYYLQCLIIHQRLTAECSGSGDRRDRNSRWYLIGPHCLLGVWHAGRREPQLSGGILMRVHLQHRGRKEKRAASSNTTRPQSVLI